MNQRDVAERPVGIRLHVADLVDAAHSHPARVVDGQREGGLRLADLDQFPPGPVVDEEAVEIGEVEGSARIAGDVEVLDARLQNGRVVRLDQGEAALGGVRRQRADE